MPAPTILTGANESKTYDMGDAPYSGDGSHTQSNVTIPANAKTAIIGVNVDGLLDPNSITLNDGTSNLSHSFTIGEISGFSTEAKNQLLAVYDVSAYGAITATVTTTVGVIGTAQAIFFVLLSDGYLKNTHSSGAFGSKYDITFNDPDGDDTVITQIITSNGANTTDLTNLVNCTEVFEGGVTTCNVNCVQTTGSNSIKSISYENDADENRRYTRNVFTFQELDPANNILGKIVK